MAQNVKPKNDELSSSDNHFLGITLALIGVMVLLLNVVKIDAIAFLILPTLGVLFLGWGFYTRRFGLIIPGYILTGLGTALFVTQTVPDLQGEALGGIFVLGLALSFAAITLISPYFERKLVLWPLIPAAIIGTVGVLLLIGTTDALHLLEILGSVWPLGLIAAGAYFLLTPRTRKG